MTNAEGIIFSIFIFCFWIGFFILYFDWLIHDFFGVSRKELPPRKETEFSRWIEDNDIEIESTFLIFQLWLLFKIGKILSKLKGRSRNV